MIDDVLPSVAQRYRVSLDAARQVLSALQKSGGTMAMFDHPELGGRGQWMPGMVMIGQMDDAQLRAKVDGLCAEIAALVRGSESAGTNALHRPPQTGAAAAEAQFPAGDSWWPALYGNRPAAVGENNGVRYAYFPDARRLLIQEAGRIDAYDTGIYHITGVGQAHEPGRPHALTFSSRAGEVPLTELKRVDLGE